MENGSIDTLIQLIGAGLFGVAVLHTFATKWFDHLSHTHSKHAGLWHLLGEVEVVFGFWAMVLIVAIGMLASVGDAVAYLDSRQYTEPLFVFAILVIAGTRPVLDVAGRLVDFVVRLLPLAQPVALYLVLLAVVPLLGSFITEPAAMTLAALMLRDRYFRQKLSRPLQYATLAVLLVNISIGGVLTPYAAPPVLMVASTWGWDTAFMLTNFGWKAAIAVFVNAGVATWLFRGELATLAMQDQAPQAEPVPLGVVIMHLLFLAGTVVFAHHPAVFLGLFLFFLGYTEAYPKHQDPLLLREGLLVGFFLAGLVVLGGMQQWWLQPLIAGMEPLVLFFGATALTAITDNAALTYLGSLVEDISDPAKYALVAGAVTGGGLTVIANAPNPAGFAILGEHFHEGAINPMRLLLFALAPTLVPLVCFLLL